MRVENLTEIDLRQALCCLLLGEGMVIQLNMFSVFHGVSRLQSHADPLEVDGVEEDGGGGLLLGQGPAGLAGWKVHGRAFHWVWPYPRFAQQLKLESSLSSCPEKPLQQDLLLEFFQNLPQPQDFVVVKFSKPYPHPQDFLGVMW